MARIARAGWFPRRGEVYFVHLDRDRPAMVISADSINRFALDVCLVPITTVERPKFSLRVPVDPPDGGLSKPSWIKCDQATTLEKALLVYPPLGRVKDETLAAVEQGIKLALKLR